MTSPIKSNDERITGLATAWRKDERGGFGQDPNPAELREAVLVSQGQNRKGKTKAGRGHPARKEAGMTLDDKLVEIVREKRRATYYNESDDEMVAKLRRWFAALPEDYKLELVGMRDGGRTARPWYVGLTDAQWDALAPEQQKATPRNFREWIVRRNSMDEPKDMDK